MLVPYAKTITEAAMIENEEKRISGVLADLKTRNLGVSTDPKTIVTEKTNKMWAAYHKVIRRVAGVKLS